MKTLDRTKYKGTELTKDILQKEQFDAWIENDCIGMILSATGTGKSKLGVIASQHTVKQDPNALIVIGVPTEKLRDENWKNEFERWDAVDLWRNNIVRSCYSSLSKIEGETIELFVADEGHRLTELSATFFKKNTVKRVLILTATEPEKPEKKKLIREIAPIIFVYTLDEAVEDGLVAPFEIVLLKMPLSEEKDLQVVTRSGRKSTYSESSRYRFINTTLLKYQDDFKSKVENFGILWWQAKDYREKLLIAERQLKLQGNTPKSPNHSKLLDEKMCELMGVDDNRIQVHKAYLNIEKIYDRMILNQRMLRMQLIYNLDSKIKYSKKLLEIIGTDDKRVIVFCASKIAAEEIVGKDRVFHSSSDSIKNKNAKNTAFDKFKAKLINLLGAIKALNEGMSIDEINDLLIEQLTSKELDLIQRIGRAIRLRAGHLAKVFILIARDTVDEEWANKALKNFDAKRVSEYYIDESTDLVALIKEINEELNEKYKGQGFVID